MIHQNRANRKTQINKTHHFVGSALYSHHHRPSFGTPFPWSGHIFALRRRFLLAAPPLPPPSLQTTPQSRCRTRRRRYRRTYKWSDRRHRRYRCRYSSDTFFVWTILRTRRGRARGRMLRDSISVTVPRRRMVLRLRGWRSETGWPWPFFGPVSGAGSGRTL